MQKDKLMRFFDRKARFRDRWIRKNWYYNKKIIDFMRFHIPKKSSILEIGSGTGFLLNALYPIKGTGIDFSRNMTDIADRKYPHLRFINSDAIDYKLNEKFDYIIISDTLGYLEDIQGVLRNLRQNCNNRTRIIITTYNYLWDPILRFFEQIGLKMRQPFTNWLSSKEIAGILELEGYDVVKSGEMILLPKNIPLLSTFCNNYLSKLPGFRRLCLVQYIIARPLETEPRKEKIVSIIVAARNEEGNIEKVAKSLPILGAKTEIIFIEGCSKDNTWEEVKRVAGKYKNVRYARQDGTGKGDAVRKGFAMAKGDILIIYDADMTVPANDLNKFYEAIVTNKGEFINGSRLVYPMEKQAMRTLNLLGNKIFSLIFSWLLSQRIKDTLCGTKAITKENYEILSKNRKYFGDFDPFGDFDLLFGASKMDLKIVEVPIRYRHRTYGDTNIRRFAHGWLLLKMCIFAMRRIKFV